MFPECAGIDPKPSRWRHGWSRRRPGLPRYLTAFPVTPGESRLFYFNLKQPATWAGSTRFILVLQGCPRWHGSSRFIPNHQTGMNRHLQPGQWERGYSLKADKISGWKFCDSQKLAIFSFAGITLTSHKIPLRYLQQNIYKYIPFIVHYIYYKANKTRYLLIICKIHCPHKVSDVKLANLWL